MESQKPSKKFPEFADELNPPQPKTDFLDIINHFKALLPCESFVITGSYALKTLGLMERVKDLDVIIVKPGPTVKDILENLKVPLPEDMDEDYALDSEQYRVKFGGMFIDFFISSRPEPFIELGNGLRISYPADVAKVKRNYKSLKHTLQLKNIAEKFFFPEDLTARIRTLQTQHR